MANCLAALGCGGGASSGGGGGGVPDAAHLTVDLNPALGTYQNAGRTTPAVLDGATVAGWADQSGNGNHVQTGNGTCVLKLAQLNGQPSVRFDGTASGLVGLTNLTFGQVYSLYAVVRSNSGSYVQHIVNADLGTTRVFQFRYDAATNINLIAFNTAVSTFSATKPNTSGAFVLAEAVCDATPQVTAFINAVAGAPTAITGTPQNGASPWYLGSRSSAGLLGGDLCRVLIYAAVAHNTAQRQTVEAYLNGIYAIY